MNAASQLPAAIRDHPLVQLRVEHLESFGTSNFTLPRFLVLAELLKEFDTVVMQDMDLIHRRPLPGTGTTFVKSGWQRHPDMMADPWGREAMPVLASICRFSGELGLRIAEDIRDEIQEMPDRDRWGADQVALYRAIRRVGESNVEWWTESLGQPAQDDQSVWHPHHHDKLLPGGSWDRASTNFRNRWERLKKGASLSQRP